MLSNRPSENRFLIVDNYPFGRDALRRTLLTMGVQQVDIAVSASAAISMCRKMDYDFVLSDYDLGEGKNGQQLLEELRGQKLFNNVSAFVILTAETTRDIVLNTLEFQPDDYLAKPYNQNLLIRRVKRLLRFKSSLHEVFQSVDGGNYPLAIQDCENYLEDNDEFRSNGLRILADLYQSVGELESALNIYDTELVARDSDWARLGLANVYMQQGKMQEAEALFLELININYMYIEAYENLSSIYLQQEQIQKAEDIMAKAIMVSPLSLRRQQLYAGICEKNNHFDNAINGWRNIIKIARNSKYEAADNHLNLARCLSDFCDHHNSYNDPVITKELFDNFTKMRAKFHVFGDAELQALFIEGRTYYLQGDKLNSKQRMDEAEKIFNKNPSAFSESSQLEFAKSLSQTGNDEQAGILLRKLASSSVDPQILSKADKVLDEPVSKDGKDKIIKLNRQGIKYFKAGEYQQAVVAFREAQTFFTKNIELNLNLVQALVKLIKTNKNGSDRELWLTEAEQCLINIRNIPASHKKYSNYQRLSKELEGLESEQAA
ncbi:tetratricopeptide repeat-containing response regulator [Oceanicoccus sp. KOV_DT_Chl]|uniref:tetratricopeptide repeat-containing response regulator n=1 Tax=Oceanicoccus sp. KOV_DT_Chl TaxID=1904639 RepID=UPI000C79588F|nr:tetratricopeptide repeat-containing response regulator [Oceanicoccus sp. KOV_DT_Chl]